MTAGCQVGDQRSAKHCRYFGLNRNGLVLIISVAAWNGRKCHGRRWCFVGPLVPFGCFSVEFPTVSKIKDTKLQKCRVLPCRLGSPTTPLDFWQHYRGFGNLGRSGPGTVRSGQKGNGKIRHFRNEGCVQRGREAWWSCGTPTTLGPLRHRTVDL